MVRAKLKFRLHRAVIVLICLALLVALMQGASWFSQNSQKQRNPQLEELARTLAHPGGHASDQVRRYFISRVAERVDHANGRKVNHLSHPDIEW